MQAFYDFHIHSCLSPCANDEMTPNNIANMCMLSELNAIALTDHNSYENCKALSQLCTEREICFVPGMELSTSEEIHVVCLFKNLDQVQEFGEYVKNHQIIFKNRPEVYGMQTIMNHLDKATGTIDRLLWVATDISVISVKELVESYGGTCFPAHIDRESNSIIAVLGDIPPECNFTTVEIRDASKLEELKKNYPILNKMRFVFNSDAHNLERIKEKSTFLEIPNLTPESLINFLNSERG